MPLVARTYGTIKCIFCGENYAMLSRYSIDQEFREFGKLEYRFSRTYQCHSCLSQFGLCTMEETYDSTKLIEKDTKWAENLKS